MKRVRASWWWVIGGAGVVVVALVTTLIVVNLVRSDRDQRYIEAIRSDETVSLGDVPDSQLLETLDNDCELLSGGWTLDDELEKAERNWAATKGIGDITEAQYFANVRGLFQAALAVC